jgi:peptidoglycan/LPS O-acetylase OafA/YrhL
MGPTEVRDLARSDTKFLRFIAIVLIINSHLEGYYPLRYLSTGGALGNALFFALSAFGLVISERKNPKTFSEWYTQRIKRIYPTVWIVLMLLTLPFKLYTNALDENNFLTFLGYFFYPPFWFLQLLLIYYLLTFPLIKKNNTKYIHYLTIPLILMYTFVYLFRIDLSVWSIEDSIFMQTIFYFMIFLFGACLAEKQDNIRYSGLQDWGFLLLSVSLIYGHKYLMLKSLATSVQFVQQFFLFPFIYYFLKVSRSGFIRGGIMQLPATSRIVNYISDMTLELYLVHLYAVIFVLKLNLAFPINIIVLLSLSLGVSALVKYIRQEVVMITVSRDRMNKEKP